MKIMEFLTLYQEFFEKHKSTFEIEQEPVIDMSFDGGSGVTDIIDIEYIAEENIIRIVGE